MSKTTKKFCDFRESLEETKTVANERELKRAWQAFLKAADKAGYYPQPNRELGFRPQDTTPHEVGGRVTLMTPSKKELGIA